MAERQQVNIDVDKLGGIAHVGIRRAVMFLGIGLNAARREDFNDYQLSKIPPIPGQTSIPMEFFPDNLPVDRIREFKEEFGTWVTGCGLRELLEHYALFLDHMHRFGLLVLHSRGKLDGIDPVKEQERFNRRLGVPDKLATLRDRLGVETKHSDSIVQLYEARNCLTHDLGVVAPKRCGPNGAFALSWRAQEFFGQGDTTGQEYAIANLIGARTKEPISIMSRQVMREKRFKAGARLQLSQQDLWEICFFFHAFAVPSATASFVEFLKVHAVEFKQRP